MAAREWRNCTEAMSAARNPEERRMWPVCSFTTFLIGTLLILLVTLLGIMEPLGQVGGPFTTVVKSIKPACLPSGFCVELLGESFAPWTGVFRHPKLSFGVLMTTLPVTDARAL